MKNVWLFVLLLVSMRVSAQRDSVFTETDVTLVTATGTIYGSLIVPSDSKRIPVVLLISGSGPTDRDGNNSMMKNNSLKMLARGLAQNNIASLRYDKRAIAASAAAFKTEEELRFEDYINDARGWVDLLKKDKRFSQVIIAGHSEGSMIGMLAMQYADKYISIAGAGRAAAVILKEQFESQPPQIRELANPILDSLSRGLNVSDVPVSLAAVFRKSVQPYMMSWFKYDPAVEIKKLKCPVLIVQGTSDLQVAVKDAHLLSSANANAQLLAIEGMNHVLKIVGDDITRNRESYNNPTMPLPDDLIKGIADFILKPTN